MDRKAPSDTRATCGGCGPWSASPARSGTLCCPGCATLEYSCFFSSRRRHTRYWRDWSSDVCSSDLAFGLVLAIAFFSATLLAVGAAGRVQPELMLPAAVLTFVFKMTVIGLLLFLLRDKIGRASCRERV